MSSVFGSARGWGPTAPAIGDFAVRPRLPEVSYFGVQHGLSALQVGYCTCRVPRVPKKQTPEGLLFLVRQKGLEPPTPCLEGRCCYPAELLARVLAARGLAGPWCGTIFCRVALFAAKRRGKEYAFYFTVSPRGKSRTGRLPFDWRHDKIFLHNFMRLALFILGNR